MLRPLIILLMFTAGAMAISVCEESDQIACRSSDRCIRMRYVCDGDNDCGDNADEDEELCERKHHLCPKGQAYCDTDCFRFEEFCYNPRLNHCRENLDPRICQMLHSGKLQYLRDIIVPGEYYGNETVRRDVEETIQKGEDFNHLTESTIKHQDCPQLFTKVGDMCLSIFYMGNMTWGEAEQFCTVLGSKLFTPKRSSEIDLIAHHIRSHPITSDFWIGGNFYNNTIGWRWINDDPMELHTNHWAIEYDSTCHQRDVLWEYRNETEQANGGLCYNYRQAPYVQNPRGSCVAMTYNRFFFFSDEECSMKMSPLCRFSK